MPCTSYTSPVPYPPLILPKYPFECFSLSTRLITFSVSLESPSVNSSSSVFLSITSILSTKSASRFLVAASTLPPKNSFPLISTLVIFSPSAVNVPSLPTCTPGNFFIKSSTVALDCVLKLLLLYTTVSPFIKIGILRACTITSFIDIAADIISISKLALF